MRQYDYHCMTLIFKKLDELRAAIAKIDYYTVNPDAPYRQDGLERALAQLSSATDWFEALTQLRKMHDVRSFVADFEHLRCSVDSYYIYKDKPFFRDFSLKGAIKW